MSGSSTLPAIQELESLSLGTGMKREVCRIGSAMWMSLRYFHVAGRIRSKLKRVKHEGPEDKYYIIKF